MQSHRFIGAALLVAAIVLPGAAFAATAYTSDRISVFGQPRFARNDIVGLLPAGIDVDIQRCTASGDWCRVSAGGLIGWIPASYIIGAAAKADATPLQSLTSPPVSDQDSLNRRKPVFWW